jgi:hypothetical protein
MLELPESVTGFSEEECSRGEFARLFRDGNGGGHERGKNSASTSSPNMLWRESEFGREEADSSELEDLCGEFGIFSAEEKRRGNAGGLGAFSILIDKCSEEEAEEGLLNNQLFSFKKCAEDIKKKGDASDRHYRGCADMIEL